jgi:hypothetical protein
MLLGEFEEFGRRFLLEVFEFDFPHREAGLCNGSRGGSGEKARGDAKIS